jgi:hypothetical protein
VCDDQFRNQFALAAIPLQTVLNILSAGIAVAFGVRFDSRAVMLFASCQTIP